MRSFSRMKSRRPNSLEYTCRHSLLQKIPREHVVQCVADVRRSVRVFSAPAPCTSGVPTHVFSRGHSVHFPTSRIKTIYYLVFYYCKHCSTAVRAVERKNALSAMRNFSRMKSRRPNSPEYTRRHSLLQKIPREHVVQCVADVRQSVRVFSAPAPCARYVPPHVFSRGHSVHFPTSRIKTGRNPTTPPLAKVCPPRDFRC